MATNLLRTGMAMVLVWAVFNIAQSENIQSSENRSNLPSNGTREVTENSLSDRLTASLITAWPGSDIYELCGHEAIRIKGDGIDSVWNFGIFNFNEPNFVYRFVKGETDYMVQGYPFSWFLPDYVERGSRVEEQVLSLNAEETSALRKLLQRHALPPLNRYRYNYIKNNCSTQIADLLDSVAGGKIEYTAPLMHSTYRETMRDYHRNYPWYQMGIDLALGSGLEEELTQREELFVPVEFNRHAAEAYLPDGRKLVKETIVLNEGRDDAVLPPTPFLLTPLWFAIVVAAISAIVIIYAIRRKKIAKWWYAVFFGAEGLAGCVVTFLVFFSEHAATSPNLLIFWLNPLQLIIPAFIWSKRMQPVVRAMIWLNIAAVGLLLVLMPVIDKGQAGQVSFLILMASDVALSIGWIIGSMSKKGTTVRNKRRRGTKTLR